MKKTILMFVLMLFALSAFATDVTITGSTDTDDTDIYGGLPNDCYGGRTFFRTGDGFGGIQALLRFDVSSIPAGATITAAKITLTKTGGDAGAGDVSIVRLHRTWIEGNETTGGCTDGCTPTDWDDANSFAWTDPAAACANDAGTDNAQAVNVSCQADSADRQSTAEDVVSVSTNGTYEFFPLLATVEGHVDGSIVNNGWILFRTAAIDYTWSSSEHATPGNRPKLEVTYTPPTGGQKVMIKQ